MLAFEAKTGGKSSRLHSKPNLRADCRVYREGFRALSNARQFSQSALQPIPIVEVLAYVELAGINKGYPAEKFLRIVQAMDATYLDCMLAKQKKRQ